MHRLRTFGRYRLLELVASGGMAEVWRAEAPGAEGFVKEVALKLIRGDHDARGDFVRMFVQEARLASRLNHANIVQVFDFDQVDGRYYIAMELVRGRTLREVADRCREMGLRLGLARAVHVCAEVARALAYAHRFAEGGAPVGLVHRDVSPQNVLLSYEGEVKLTDFGIARALGTSEVTAPGIIKGKLAYMAPEQARGEDVDGRADVFAAGVMLWELCTGRRLFARDSDAATLGALIAPQPISPPSAWNESVPPDLDAIVLAALERDLARRTASAEELAASLASLRLRLSTCARSCAGSGRKARRRARRSSPMGRQSAPCTGLARPCLQRSCPPGRRRAREDGYGATHGRSRSRWSPSRWRPPVDGGRGRGARARARLLRP
jgi:serine/threonine-protein kinase